MFKIKHARTADCVVAGYRLHKSGPDAIGSLLLGLYTTTARWPSVGVIGAFPMAAAARALHRAAAAGHDVRRASLELGRRTDRQPSSRGTRERRRPRAGTPARTCRSCRCGRSWWSRCATTTWRARGSGTPPSSTAGGRTATPESCTYDQLERPVTFELADIVPGLGVMKRLPHAQDLAGVRLPSSWAVRACCTWCGRSSTSRSIPRRLGRPACLGHRFRRWPKLPVPQGFPSDEAVARQHWRRRRCWSWSFPATSSTR